MEDHGCYLSMEQSFCLSMEQSFCPKCLKGAWTPRNFYGSKILSCSGLKIAMEHAH